MISGQDDRPAGRYMAVFTTPPRFLHITSFPPHSGALAGADGAAPGLTMGHWIPLIMLILILFKKMAFSMMVLFFLRLREYE